MDLDEFTRKYIETALWVLGGTPEWTHDSPPTIDDLSDLARARMINACSSFKFAASEYFEGKESRAGHDFWLTRNGHGAGFWDGDWPEPAATILTVAAKACGEVDLIVGDDGKIHCE